LWRNRGWVAGLFRRAAGALSGFEFGDAQMTVGGRGDPAIAIRQLRRYAFAAMQDQSPIVGLTHASYAMMALDLLEEVSGRETIKAAGFDPAEVRKLITGLQDKHAEALRKCDPYISRVLDLERREGGQLPGFVMAGAAPMGA
jgi:hypothetical protein